MESKLHVGNKQCGAMLARLAVAGMTVQANFQLSLSTKGREDYQRLVGQREDDLKKMLADWKPDEHPDVLNMMRQLAHSFASSPPTRPERFGG